MALVGRRRLVPPILGSVILIGVALALSAFSTAAGATVVLLAVVGGGRALFNLASRTLLQRAVPAEVVGRVFGVAESIAMTGLQWAQRWCRSWLSAVAQSPLCSALRRSFRW
jgi:hypothetical protein